MTQYQDLIERDATAIPCEAHVRVEDHPEDAVLYRVGHRSNSQGLWYDADGRATGIIDTLSDGGAAALPMGPHSIFRDQSEHWISVTTSLEDLRNWFSEADIIELDQRGYEVLAVLVRGYRTLHFPTYSHAVFALSRVMGFGGLLPSDLYPALQSNEATNVE